MNPAELVRAALEVRERAYAPYSNFAVGAALLTDDGRIYRACNVENASYGLTICAERSAFVMAVADSARKFSALAIANGPGARMCGACRQFANEFAPDLVIHLADRAGTFTTTTLDQLLPRGFGPPDLGK